MFIPDANLVLNLLKASSTIQALPNSYQDYLRITKNKTYKSWHSRGKWIPVNPFLAIMELSKQDEKKDFDKYRAYFKDFFFKVYRIKDLDPKWIYLTYEAAFKAQFGFHSSIQNTVEIIYECISLNDRPTDSEIISGYEKFIKWVWSNKDNLAVIGGLLSYVAVYAIAGNPEAQQLLKVRQARKKESSKIANNVAWDFLYWISLDFDYHSNKYKNTIICTGDKSLSNLLGGIERTGPRTSTAHLLASTNIEADANVTPYKFKRLEKTKLEKKLYNMYLELQLNLERSVKGFTRFGYENIY